jgi:murein DD-endopeptidase MepM/ murein hydrolase activator NlpD
VAKTGISGVSVAAIAAGTLLVVSGVRDAPVLDALRDLMQGRPPQGRAPRMTLVSAGKAVGAAQRPAGKAAGRLTRPVSGSITSGFGPRGGRMHKGVDIPMPTGTPILAADAGRVTDTGYEPLGAGNFVKVRHENGWVTKYFHMSAIRTTRGAEVHAGDVLGLVGTTGHSSGPHLHFELWIDGSAVDPSGYI